MDHPKEGIILCDDEDKDNDFFNEEEYNCAVMRLSRREIRPVERI